MEEVVTIFGGINSLISYPETQDLDEESIIFKSASPTGRLPRSLELLVLATFLLDCTVPAMGRLPRSLELPFFGNIILDCNASPMGRLSSSC
jgi:hypothetical protein